VSGVLWYADSQDLVHDVIASTPPTYISYIVLVEPILFTKDNVVSMSNTNHIKGILVPYINDNTSSVLSQDLINVGFSPAKPCPNEQLGDGDTCHNWNVNGSNLTFNNFNDFAIFAITSNSSYNDLLECYDTYNSQLKQNIFDYPLCSAELKADMQAVKSTQECFQRGSLLTNLGVVYCDALGDKNVWSTLFELQQHQKVIVVSTKVTTPNAIDTCHVCN
jgi:nicastrin